VGYKKQINDFTCMSALAVYPIHQKIKRIPIKEAQSFILAT